MSVFDTTGLGADLFLYTFTGNLIFTRHPANILVELMH